MPPRPSSARISYPGTAARSVVGASLDGVAVTGEVAGVFGVSADGRDSGFSAGRSAGKQAVSGTASAAGGHCVLFAGAAAFRGAAGTPAFPHCGQTTAVPTVFGALFAGASHLCPCEERPEDGRHRRGLSAV